MQGQTMTADETAIMDQHEVGTYWRNINTGFHELDIMLNGANGRQIKVPY